MKLTNLLVFVLIMASSFACFAQWDENGQTIVYTYDKAGINTMNPSTQLSLGTVISSRKLSLYDNNSYWYGFGVLAGQMRLQVGTSNDKFSFFAGNSLEVLTLTGSSKLGLNASNPISSFQVWNGIAKFSAGSAYGSSMNWGTSYIGFNAARNGAQNNWTFDGDNAHNGGSAIYGGVSGHLFFACRPSSSGADVTISDSDLVDEIKMTVYSDGKVRVGDAATNDNDYLLFVKKGIKTGRVKTDASLADYVFQEDYEVMPLSEVEEYVWENKHLPGVISDKEVQENGGVELTSFTISLQEKLEELYLHVIDVEKRLGELEEENAILKQSRR